MSKCLRFAVGFVTMVLLCPIVRSQDWPAFLLYQKGGAAAGDRMGWAVAPAGDVNGDGRDDFISGAYFADPGGLVNAGSAYVYSGLDGSLLYQKDGGAPGDLLGNYTASIGDVNGDGKGEFIFAAYAADPGGLENAGSVYVYSGADGSLLYRKDGAAAGDILGISVASAGDVNGDGKNDFICGAYNTDPGGISNAGSAYVYSGADGSLLYQKDGLAADDFLGNSVNSAGDVNGDGLSDFIIGAYGADPAGLSAGSAYLYSGADGALLYQRHGAAAGERLGISVASAGDVNADGRSDFMIGAYEADPNGLVDAGSAYVYSGLDGSLLYQKDGAEAYDILGFPVASAGDVNGDGRPDFMIGAFRADPNGLVDAGSVYLYSGADGSLLYQKNGDAAGDQLGYMVSTAGDVDGNGRSDFIIGAFRADPDSLLNAGTTYVYSFCTAPPGDMNYDGTAAPADVVALMYCVFSSGGNCELCFADENCDGVLSAADVTLEINRVFLETPFVCAL